MLGERIKAYILESGMKLCSVADKVNIPMNTFSAMMNGKRKNGVFQSKTINIRTNSAVVIGIKVDHGIRL